jgi:hypothetical protein
MCRAALGIFALALIAVFAGLALVASYANAATIGA